MTQIAQTNIVDYDNGKNTHERPMQILAVEDNRLELAFMEEQIKTLGHNTLKASNGQEALDLLKSKGNHIDVILMDRLMPVMDGLTAVKLLKKNPAWAHIPVIMVTGADSVEDIKEGLDAGVFYYLTKPVDENVFRSVLSAAVRDARYNNVLNEELTKHHSSFNMIQTCKFSFSTLAQAESLALFVSNCFPVPARVLPGIAELFVNALEHGNLGIGYETKAVLMDRGTWQQEIERRSEMPENKTKTVDVVITRKDDGVALIITDMGQGFDWKRYMIVDPARSTEAHGRGIAQANAMSFDKLTYNDAGNQAVAFVRYNTKPLWRS
ncbi:MAG: response regulator [Alphaproteobacteria bacterium]|nr:response regulator [Alphaproteobacteria bacterium]